MVSHVHSQAATRVDVINNSTTSAPQVPKMPRLAWVENEARKAFNKIDNPKSPLYFPKIYSHVRFMPDGNIQHYFEFILKGNETAMLQNEGR